MVHYIILKKYFISQAKEKKATAVQSGLVFAAFEFTMVFMAPVMGNFVRNNISYIFLNMSYRLLKIR